MVGPGYSPKNDAYFPVPDVKTYVKYDPPLPPSFKIYCFVQYVVTVLGHLALMNLGKHASFAEALPLSLLLLLNLASIGRLLDGEDIDLRAVFLEKCKDRGEVFDPSKVDLASLHPSHPFHPGPKRLRPNIWLLETARLL